VDECEEEHSEVLEVYTTKSVVLKHAGDLQGAAEAADKAQSLDKADRSLFTCLSPSLLPFHGPLPVPPPPFSFTSD